MIIIKLYSHFLFCATRVIFRVSSEADHISSYVPHKNIVSTVTDIFHNPLYSIDKSSGCIIVTTVIFTERMDINAETGKTTIRESIIKKMI